MPAKAINLLPNKDFDRTPVGKFLRWSLTYGRYIIISTEIIVLMAFIYRFSLDRKITDLNEDIEGKSAIVQANLGFEARFRNLQERTNQISGFFTNQGLVITVLEHLQSITPTGIHFTQFLFSGPDITITAVANTSNSLAVFLDTLKHSELLSSINVTGLNKKSDTGETLFTVEARVKESLQVTTNQNE